MHFLWFFFILGSVLDINQFRTMFSIGGTENFRSQFKKKTFLLSIIFTLLQRTKNWSAKRITSLHPRMHSENQHTQKAAICELRFPAMAQSFYHRPP